MVFWFLPPCRTDEKETGDKKGSADSDSRLLRGLLFDPEDAGDKLLRNAGLFPKLHGLTIRKTVLFIVTDVRT
jgi:hypothetical protein